MAIGIGIYLGVPKQRVTIGGGGDLATELTFYYKEYVESIGGTLIDEVAVKAEYEDLISKSEHELETYVFGYQFGMVKNESNEISKLIGLVKVNGNYPIMQQTTPNSLPIWATDYIQFYDGTYGKNFVLQNNLGYAKNSFYTETIAKKQYISGLTYSESSNPTTSGLRHGTQSTNRLLVLTYNISGSANATSNNDYFLNEFATYRVNYVRTGDSCVPTLLRNGESFQAMGSRTWDRPLETAFQLTGCSTASHELKKFKMALIQ